MPWPLAIGFRRSRHSGSSRQPPAAIRPGIGILFLADSLQNRLQEPPILVQRRFVAGSQRGFYRLDSFGRDDFESTNNTRTTCSGLGVIVSGKILSTNPRGTM